jgi:hypothetical protein
MALMFLQISPGVAWAGKSAKKPVISPDSESQNGMKINHLFFCFNANETAAKAWKFLLIFLLINGCSYLCVAQSDPGILIKSSSWLPIDSTVLIQRINPTPQIYFNSEAEAKKWADDYQAHRIKIEPSVEYYRLWISQDSYVIREYKKDAENKFSPAGNFFVGICGNHGWVYEEDPKANRVICITNLSLLKIDAGPYTGLLSTTVSFYNEFLHFGTYGVDLNSLNFASDKGGSFNGNTSTGIPITGTLVKTGPDNDVLSTWVFSYSNLVSHMAVAVTIAFSNSIEQTSYARILHGQGDWADGMTYILKEQGPLPDNFNATTFWAQNTNSTTALFRYDCAEQVLITTLSGGTEKKYPNARPILATSERWVPTVKLVILVCFASSTLLLAWVYLKNRTKNGSNTLNN